ncbi:hypothetical protein BCR34DRAFT_585725 [Clohesyomyces aquaticus]|uniref:Enoyl reductase (ER) domain-containing protein n=1 Tax=Clohesyomyces aquaticus TaxID=1231657 RepID=A0A1Y1ZWD2_9PLEO|nr:hypothetical protein BCR34DRAFT_585725 [Clohesyomyces aquaticus]
MPTHTPIISAQARNTETGIMRALILKAENRTASLNKISQPTPGPYEILVKVHSISLNPIDPIYVTHPLAKSGRTIGSDFAGTIAQLGSSVSNLNLGDRVAGFLQGACSVNERPGAFAEFLVIGWDLVWKIPANVSLEQASAVSLVALTAAQGMWFRLGLEAPFSFNKEKLYEEHPEWVRSQTSGENRAKPINFFVYGASTSVGLYAAQMVRLSAQATGVNIRLIGAASKARWDMLKSEPYGYDHLVDYRDQNWPEQVRAVYEGAGMDYAYDCISEGRSVELVSSTLAPNGKAAIVRSRAGGAWKAEELSVEPIYGAVWEGLGEEVQYQGFVVKRSPAARIFAAEFYKWLSKSVGISLMPNPIRLMPGGFGKVVDDGFALLGPGKMEDRCIKREEEWMRPVSAEKLVYVVGERQRQRVVTFGEFNKEMEKGDVAPCRRLVDPNLVHRQLCWNVASRNESLFEHSIRIGMQGAVKRILHDQIHIDVFGGAFHIFALFILALWLLTTCAHVDFELKQIHIRLQDRQTCSAGTQYYVCSSNGFRGCCAEDPCSLSGCPGDSPSPTTAAPSNAPSSVSSSNPISNPISISPFTSPTLTTAIPSSIVVERSFSLSALQTIASISGDHTVYITVTPGVTSTSQPSNSPKSSANSEGSKKSSTPTGAIAGGVIGGIVVLAIIIVMLFILRKKKKAKVPSSDLPEIIGGDGTLHQGPAAASVIPSTEKGSGNEKTMLETTDPDGIAQLDGRMIRPTNEMPAHVVGTLHELPTVQTPRNPVNPFSTPDLSTKESSQFSASPNSTPNTGHVLSWAENNSVGRGEPAARLSAPHGAPDACAAVWSNMGPIEPRVGEKKSNC